MLKCNLSTDPPKNSRSLSKPSIELSSLTPTNKLPPFEFRNDDILFLMLKIRSEKFIYLSQKSFLVRLSLRCLAFTRVFKRPRNNEEFGGSINNKRLTCTKRKKSAQILMPKRFNYILKILLLLMF